VRTGVPAQSIMVIGRGEAGLVMQTADGVREPQNRRVEGSGKSRHPRWPAPLGLKMKLAVWRQHPAHSPLRQCCIVRAAAAISGGQLATGFQCRLSRLSASSCSAACCCLSCCCCQVSTGALGEIGCSALA
jgi:hypothetical protein